MFSQRVGITILATALLVSCTTTSAQLPAAANSNGVPPSIDGAWKIDWAGDGPHTLSLDQDDESVTGSYSFSNGELVAANLGKTVEGYWIQDSSNMECPTPVQGRYHWGRFKMTFLYTTPVGSTPDYFVSMWGHSDDEPSRRDWIGWR